MAEQIVCPCGTDNSLPIAEADRDERAAHLTKRLLGLYGREPTEEEVAGFRVFPRERREPTPTRTEDLWVGLEEDTMPPGTKKRGANGQFQKAIPVEGFCPHCGVSLWSGAPARPEEFPLTCLDCDIPVTLEDALAAS